MGRFVFTEEELDIIVACVEKRKSVIENKKTNKTLQDAKQQAWESIATEIRLWPGVRPISAKQIKKCWENLKARARQELKQVIRPACDNTTSEYQMCAGAMPIEPLIPESSTSKRIDRVRTIIGFSASESVSSDLDDLRMEDPSFTPENFIKVEAIMEGPIEDSSMEPSDPLDNILQETSTTSTIPEVEPSTQEEEITSEITPDIEENKEYNNNNLINHVNRVHSITNVSHYASSSHYNPTPIKSTYNTSFPRARNRMAAKRARFATPYNRSSASSSESDRSEHQARLAVLQQKMDLDLREHDARMDILKLEKAYWEAKIQQTLIQTHRS